VVFRSIFYVWANYACIPLCELNELSLRLPMIVVCTCCAIYREGLRDTIIIELFIVALFCMVWFMIDELFVIANAIFGLLPRVGEASVRIEC